MAKAAHQKTIFAGSPLVIAARAFIRASKKTNQFALMQRPSGGIEKNLPVGTGGFFCWEEVTISVLKTVSEKSHRRCGTWITPNKPCPYDATTIRGNRKQNLPVGTGRFF